MHQVQLQAAAEQFKRQLSMAACTPDCDRLLVRTSTPGCSRPAPHSCLQRLFTMSQGLVGEGLQCFAST